ncbi:MAG: hypothetical protein IID35_06380 [Planctomycetes bacterium]|nr:hypothetical protein [Planctomycetota bacterium]
MVATLLYSIAGGMLAVLATARVEQIAWRFLRFASFFAFGAACVVVVWTLRAQASWSILSSDWPTQLGCLLAGGAIVVVFMAPMNERRAGVLRVVCGISGLIGVAAACGTAVAASAGGPDASYATPMIVISQVLGAAVLGAITVAWLLGHAYLTATKMTIAPLRHFSRILTWAIVARIAFLLISVGLAWWVGRDAQPLSANPAPWNIVTLLYQSWLIVSLRVGVGLVGVGVFAFMVRDCVRLRATQSATGILYFASVFAYIGELACQQLIREWGWPI